jgi:hypothetical protein
MIDMLRNLTVTSNASDLRVTHKFLLQSLTVVQSCLFTWSQLKQSNTASEMRAGETTIIPGDLAQKISVYLSVASLIMLSVIQTI